MAVMGLARMELAGAKADPLDADAIARASGADAILGRAGRHPDLAAALAEANRAYGFTARLRSLARDPATPRAAAAAMAADLAAGLDIALVFGPEQSGLSNDELDQCDSLVAIPTASGSRSLNLAAAVQIACYELRLAVAANAYALQPQGSEAPTKEEIARLLLHFEETVAECCPPPMPGQLKRMLRRAARLLGKAAPDAADVRMLRGLATGVQKLAAKAKQ